MRLSAEMTGTVDELLLVEAAKFLLTQTDEIRKLQTELDELHVKHARLSHKQRRSIEKGFEPFNWDETPLGKIIG